MLSKIAHTPHAKTWPARPLLPNVARKRAANAVLQRAGVAVPRAADEVAAIMNRAKLAQRLYAEFDQERVDAIFKAVAMAANKARIPLAELAIAETAIGIVEDKVIKNHYASEIIYNKYKDAKTCGIVDYDAVHGISKVAEPMGVIVGVVPMTNPTSTVIFKSLLTLKTRNAIVFYPSQRATRCTIETARLLHEAAVAAGAPDGVISWVETPSREVAAALMQSADTSLILATGGPGMVKSAYSSGHPAIGVGAGNTPCVIDGTADLQRAISSVLISKTFDNGVTCPSEQSVVVVGAVYDAVVAEFRKRGAYFMSGADLDKVRAKLIQFGHLNPKIIGQSAVRLAEIFDLTVPPGTKVLIGEVTLVGAAEPMSVEKMSPMLAMYRADDFEAAIELAGGLVNFAGPGHTASLHTDPDNREHINRFGQVVKVSRVIINSPSTLGAMGDLYNLIDPSLTLGCGTWGSTSVSANVGIQHLMNIKTIAERRENMLWFKIPRAIYLKSGCLETALRELRGKQRAFVVTDRPLYEMGYATRVTNVLDAIGIKSHVFTDVPPDPTLSCVKAGLRELRAFKPDVVLAIGGGSPMDAAKVMWLMYEKPDIKFESMAMHFMDIRKKIYDIAALESAKSVLVCVPTTCGTGSEMTPFAVITDDATGHKYPLADYILTPTMSIVDPQLVGDLPKGLTALGGIDALVHAIESYVSVLATEFTKAMSARAFILLHRYLARAYENGSHDHEARENVHFAASIAGTAFANASLGICHSIAHSVGGRYHVPHGLANAAFISAVIRYNATDMPGKQAIFSQYGHPHAKSDYAELADMLNLGGATDDDKVALLIGAIDALKARLNIPAALQLAVSRDEYVASVDDMAKAAFDDICTDTNPRYPMIADIKRIIIDAYGQKRS